MEVKRKLSEFLKRETVLTVAILLAIVSAVMIPPDREYAGYIDFRTLSILFCLMTVMAGLQKLGVFRNIAKTLLRHTQNTIQLAEVLVLLCFIFSMIITNDVTLITFVPFTLLIFRMIGKQEKVITLVVMETIAANLGSMATPIGNPQNLYLFSASGLSMEQFAMAVLPYAGLSLLLLLAVLLLQHNEPVREIETAVPETGKETGASQRVEEKGQAAAKPGLSLPALLPFLCLLILCLLVVFRIVPYVPVLICVAAAVLVINKRLFLSVDYCLLLTFLFFFIFIGNLKRIPALDDLLFSVIQGNELWGGILASQVISNVPAAILLSGFTENVSVLITAVNLGGLGTLIASLASLISFQFYAAEYPGRKGCFLKIFTLWNGIFLLILTGEALLLA